MAASLRTGPAAPVVLNVSIGHSCNNRCIFCLDRGRGLPVRFTLPEIEEQLERGRSLTDVVIFTNAEPTLSRLLTPAVAAARARGYERVSLVTNGRRLARAELCRELLEAGLNEVTVSLHGPTAAAHDALTRRPGSFDEAVAGLRNLQRARARGARLGLLLNCTLGPANLHLMREMHALASSFGVDRLNFNVVEPRGRAADELATTMPRYAAVIDAADGTGLDFDQPSLSLSRVPVCAGGLEWVQEDYHFVRGDEVTHYDPAEGKVKGPPCERCALAGRCAGVFERYVQGYGWDELVPLTAPDERRGEQLRATLGSPCDNRCAGCRDGPAAGAPPPGRSVHRQLREGWLRGYRQVELGGGDPLCSPDLPAVVRFARKLGYSRVSLETNGRRLRHARTLDELRRAGVDEIIIKLNAGRPRQNDRLAGAPGAFKQTLRALGLLSQQHFPFALRLRSRDEADLARARQLGEVLGAARVELG